MRVQPRERANPVLEREHSRARASYPLRSPPPYHGSFCRRSRGVSVARTKACKRLAIDVGQALKPNRLRVDVAEIPWDRILIVCRHPERPVTAVRETVDVDTLTGRVDHRVVAVAHHGDVP